MNKKDTQPQNAHNNEQANHLIEHITGRSVVWSGKFLTAETLTVTLPNGNESERDIIRHPGAVGIIALNDQHELLLVRQYRTAVEAVTYEIPAGKLEPGEKPEVTAHRELAEETGYTADSLELFTATATSIGFSDEIIHLYVATGLHKGESNPDDDEFVEAGFYSTEKIRELMKSPDLIDSKTVIALLVAEEMKAQTK